MSQNNDDNKRGRRFFANSMHREIFFLVFCSALIPMFIATLGMYYLIFHITANQIGVPEVIAYHVLPAAKKVLLIIFIGTPLAIAVILYYSHKVTHHIVGPFDRITRELGESIDGKRKGPIKVRTKDKFAPLVNRINALLEKINQHG